MIYPFTIYLTCAYFPVRPALDSTFQFMLLLHPLELDNGLLSKTKLSKQWNGGRLEEWIEVLKWRLWSLSRSHCKWNEGRISRTQDYASPLAVTSQGEWALSSLHISKKVGVAPSESEIDNEGRNCFLASQIPKWGKRSGSKVTYVATAEKVFSRLSLFRIRTRPGVQCLSDIMTTSEHDQKRVTGR